MIRFSAISKNKNQEIEAAPLKIIEQNGVLAVYADSIKRDSLDPNEAICVKFEFLEKIESILAIYKTSKFWTSPIFIDRLDLTPIETQGIFCKKNDGRFISIIPVVDKEFKTDLYGKDASLFSRTYSWYDGSNFCKDLLFVCAEGDSLFEIVKKCFNVAVELLGNRCRLREERVYPEIFEYLGWCSWDSIPFFVNEDGLESKCKEFEEKNIPVKWAIIDDMWAKINGFDGMEGTEFNDMVKYAWQCKLSSYQADTDRFPKGLKHTIHMFDSYGIKVGLWFPPTGYWNGIDENGDAYKNLNKYTIKSIKDSIVPDYSAANSYMYFKTIFDSVRKAGVNFIKIDNQALPEAHYKGLAPIGITARGLTSGMEAAVGECFSGKMINCMGMASESMWNRSSSPLSRCSGDFIPENRDWFKKHIMQCTYNGLIQGQLYYNDFDMWWTDDEQAKKNSLLRAVSGGPIYVSDKIGRTNKELFAPLILEDGRILRCERPGLPTEDCVFTDPKSSNKIFKVQNIINSCGIVAIFNLNDDETKCVEGTLSPRDVYGLKEGEYAIYEHFTRDFKVVNFTDSINVKLENSDDFKLFIIVPLNNGFGAIGRIDKFISPATIKAVLGENIALKEDGPYAYVKNRKLIIKE